jgi:diguanylate cyclase (GGDEF)-like protein
MQAPRKPRDSDEVEAEAASSGELRDRAGSKRDRAASGRDLEGDARDRAGSRRDVAGDERDAIDLLRDEAGDRRDLAAEQRDEADRQSERQPVSVTGPDALDRSARARRHAAEDRKLARDDRHAGAGARSEAGRDRGNALADRDAGATERTHAGHDRTTADADRGASAHDRATSTLDDLTGAYRRGPGLVELEREISRALRTALPLTLAFLDVDALKVTNDTHGHAAGDRLLARVAHAMREKLRTYDLIVRYGGDEFLCAVTGLDLDHTMQRMAMINPALAASREGGSVSVGFAQLLPGDTAAALVARADADLAQRRATPRRSGH